MLNKRAKSVMFISHTYDDGVFKIGSHHLAREFANKGFDVAHISTPYSWAHYLLSRNQDMRRNLMREGVRIDEAGVKHLIPSTVLPAQYNPSGYLVNAMKSVGMESPRFIFLDQPLMINPVLFRRGSVSIYRPTDLYLDGAARKLQSRYIRSFNAVSATSRIVLDGLPVVAGQRRTVIPNGVEYGRFQATHYLGARSGAAYVGALDHRFDWKALVRMASAIPELRIALVGPVGSIPTELPSNIELIGAMHYKDLPQFLSRFSVGLLPLSGAPENSGRSPMKLFEYLASGLYVVASFVQGFASRDDMHGCFFYAREEDPVHALLEALAQVGPNHRGMEAAHHQDWSIKAEQLLGFAMEVEESSAKGKVRGTDDSVA